MFFNWITVLGFNFILNVHQSQIPKTFEPSYDTKRWITEEFGERYNYEQELKIFINHYRAGGTHKSDWQYAFRSWLLRSKKFQSIQLKPPRILKNAVKGLTMSLLLAIKENKVDEYVATNETLRYLICYEAHYCIVKNLCYLQILNI